MGVSRLWRDVVHAHDEYIRCVGEMDGAYQAARKDSPSSVITADARRQLADAARVRLLDALHMLEAELKATPH